jgi:hypothetical protein
MRVNILYPYYQLSIYCFLTAQRALLLNRKYEIINLMLSILYPLH